MLSLVSGEDNSAILLVSGEEDSAILGPILGVAVLLAADDELERIRREPPDPQVPRLQFTSRRDLLQSEMCYLQPYPCPDECEARYVEALVTVYPQEFSVFELAHLLGFYSESTLCVVLDGKSLASSFAGQSLHRKVKTPTTKMCSLQSSVGN